MKDDDTLDRFINFFDSSNISERTENVKNLCP